MPSPEADHALDMLLDLHGQRYVVSQDGRWWVRFEARRVPVMVGKPYGIDYAISLFGPPRTTRWVGYDNAHGVRASAGPGGRTERAWDHRHRRKVVLPYDYTDAAALFEDFWKDVDAVLDENGVSR